MKFAHIADCHVGGWREEKLRVLSLDCFSWTVQKCVEEKVDFVLLCGDVFHTALPALDSLKVVVQGLKSWKDAGIPVYAIGGSHDWSASGKSLLEVLEAGGLLKNVMNGSFSPDGKLILEPVRDEKTGTLLTGIGGRRQGLELEMFQSLDRESLEKVSGQKIFLFHGMIEELKPKGLDGVKSVPLSLFPKGWSYYAGGHLHKRIQLPINTSTGSMLVYPGPLFPESFSELEELGHGSFVIVEDFVPKYVDVPSKKAHSITVDVTGLSPQEAVERVKNNAGEIRDCIVLIRLFGKLRGSRASQLPVVDLIRWCEDRGAFCVLRNTYGVLGDETTDVKIATGSVEDIERRVVEESKKGIFPEETTLTHSLLGMLSTERGDGETVTVFEGRIAREVEELARKMVWKR